MYNSIIIKIFLVLYSLFAGFVVWVLWRNTAAPNALQHTGIIFASIVPILILVSPYLKAEKLERVFIYALFFDFERKEITTGETSGPYLLNYLSMFTNISTSIGGDPNSRDECSKLMKAKGINIIEKGILQALLDNFSSHWDIEPKRFKGPAISFASGSNNSRLRKTTITFDQLRNIFKHNQIISQPDVVSSSPLSIPLGSLHIEQSDNMRTLVFKNSYAYLQIQIRENVGHRIQQGINGILAPDPNNKNRYWAQAYKVSVSMKLRRTKVYSPNMKAYRQWYANITEALSVYDWQIVENKIADHLNRKATSKILREN